MCQEIKNGTSQFGLGKDVEKVTQWMLEEDPEAATLTVTVLCVLHSVAELDIVRIIKDQEGGK